MGVMRIDFLIGMVCLSVLFSCSPSRELTDGGSASEPAYFYAIDGSVEADQELERYLEPWRRQVERQMNRILSVSAGPFRYGQPESALGNVTADILRYRAAHEMERFVHLAILDPSFIAAELPEGEITVGDLHELMPADERLTVLEMEGSAVRNLADEIAVEGGAPISGLRMVIRDSSASGVLVDSGSIEEGEIYFLATGHSSLATGRFPSLQEYQSRTDYDLLLRDMMIDYFRSNPYVEPLEDYRVRIR